MRLWFQGMASKALMKRRKWPVLRMVLVAFTGSVWCIAGGSWILAVWREVDAQAENVRVEIFLHSDASDSTANNFVLAVRQMPGVESARLVSGDELWNSFAREVGAEDELREIVELPSIVRFTLRSQFVRAPSLALLTAAIERQYPEIVREVVWPREFVAILDSRRSDVTILGFSAAVLSIVMFSIALMYAFRAEIHQAGGDLELGALLGASRTAIATPHFVVGVVAGVLGLVSAWVFGIIVLMNGTLLLPWLRYVDSIDVVLIASSLLVPGLIIAWSLSINAVRRAELKGR
jgi:cell division protein FtsX